MSKSGTNAGSKSGGARPGKGAKQTPRQHAEAKRQGAMDTAIGKAKRADDAAAISPAELARKKAYAADRMAKTKPVKREEASGARLRAQVDSGIAASRSFKPSIHRQEPAGKSRTQAKQFAAAQRKKAKKKK